MSLSLAAVSGRHRYNRFAQGVDPFTPGIKDLLTPELIYRENMTRIRDELIKRKILPRGYTSIDREEMKMYVDKYRRTHRQAG